MIRRIDAARALFVLLWTGGFVVGAIGVRHASALALTFWRFALAAVALLALSVATRAPWPRSRREFVNLAVTGLLIQAMQFTGAYLGLANGVPAGLAALIMSCAPIMVAVGASAWLGESLSDRQLIGFAVGITGAAVAVVGQVDHSGGVGGLLLVGSGLVGLTLGTLHQRRFGSSTDLRTGVTVQLAVAALAVLPIAAATQEVSLPLSADAIAPLLYLALVNSVGATMLMFWLLRRGPSSSTTSLLFLVPSLTALIGVPVLGQPVRVSTVVGLAVSLAGVALIQVPVRGARAGSPQGMFGERSARAAERPLPSDGPPGAGRQPRRLR